MELILESNFKNQLTVIVLSYLIVFSLALYMFFQWVNWIKNILEIRRMKKEQIFNPRLKRVTIFNNDDTSEKKDNIYVNEKTSLLNTIFFSFKALFRTIIAFFGILLIIILIFYGIFIVIPWSKNPPPMIHANKEKISLLNAGFAVETYPIDNLYNITNIHEVSYTHDDTVRKSDYLLFEFTNGDEITLSKNMFLDSYNVVINKIQKFFPHIYIERKIIRD